MSALQHVGINFCSFSHRDQSQTNGVKETEKKIPPGGKENVQDFSQQKQPQQHSRSTQVDKAPVACLSCEEKNGQIVGVEAASAALKEELADINKRLVENEAELKRALRAEALMLEARHDAMRKGSAANKVGKFSFAYGTHGPDVKILCRRGQALTLMRSWFFSVLQCC